MVLYDIDIKINPLTNEIYCDVEMKLSVNSDNLAIQLFKGFEIVHIFNYGDVVAYEEENKGLQFMPEARTIILSGHEWENIRMVYKGRLAGKICNYNNKIDKDFFLLTDYAPWYPTIKGETVNVSSVIRGVSNYHVLNGNYDYNNDCWRVEGVALVGVKNNLVERISFNGFEFSVLYYDENEKTEVLKSIEIVKDCMHFFISKIFNDNVNNGVFYYFRPKVPINDGWSFIRENIVVSQEQFANEIDMARLMAHELAHIWSTGAGMDWEDWLNESFAEYASCLFLEHRYGFDVYHRKINNHIEYNKKHFVGEAIRPKSRTSRPESVHTKGVIVLDKLRNQFGKKTIVRIIKLFIELENKTTENLLVAIKQELNEYVADQLKNMIDNPV